MPKLLAERRASARERGARSGLTGDSSAGSAKTGFSPSAFDFDIAVQGELFQTLERFAPILRVTPD